MFRAILGVCCPVEDRVIDRVRLELDDRRIQNLLDGASQGVGVTADFSVISLDGSKAVVRLVLSKAGYFCRVNGKPAGLITLDELSAALGRTLSDHGIACMVCLQGLLDVWRRGWFDPVSGEVQVFTRTPDLAFVGGARGFLLDNLPPLIDAIEFDVGEGEPAAFPMRVPSQQLRQLRAAGAAVICKTAQSGRRDAEDGIDAIVAMSSKMMTFAEGVR